MPRTDARSQFQLRGSHLYELVYGSDKILKCKSWGGINNSDV